MATAEAITTIGATPVFVDIEPWSFYLDPAAIVARITARTKAIIPCAPLFGHPADMDAPQAIAQNHNLKVLEDTAQAFGGSALSRPAGTIGAVGAWSFYPTKNLGGRGYAGLITTNDDRIAELGRMPRGHGSRKKYFSEVPGYNSRLDTLQAAILRVKLPHVDAANQARRRIAQRYHEQLAGIPGLVTPWAVPDVEHVYHQYTVVRVIAGRRDALQEFLKEAAISSTVFYPWPLHRLPKTNAATCGRLPKPNVPPQKCCSLPIWPQMSNETQDRVIGAITDFMAAAW